MMRVIFLMITILSFSFTSQAAANYEYLTVKVKKGDVLFRILLKYNLQGSACNVEEFYRLNKLKAGSTIHAGKEYKLPVKMYPFDGKSIRTSTERNDWDWAVTIRDYNKKLKEAGVKTYYDEDKIIYVPYHLEHPDCNKIAKSTKQDSAKVSGKSTAKKPSKKTGKKKYVKTDIYFGKGVKILHEDNRLKGQVFYIISGHGGPDPGAVKKKNGHLLAEDEYAYDVSLRLAKNLLNHGATVHMIIQDPNDGIRDGQYLKVDKDEFCKTKGKIPLNQLKRLQQRVSAVNNLYLKEKAKGRKKQTMISIHVDSRSVGVKQDVFFYHAEKSKKGKILADKVQKVFEQKYAKYRKGRGYKGTVTARNLYVLRKSMPKAVFVELANIQNVHNHRRILPKENRQALANWLFEGLTK